MHDQGYTGAGVVIAMLDDGFNYHNRHEALATIDIPPGFERDFVDGDWSAQDTVNFTCCSHGTLVLGCVAGNLPGHYVGTAPGATYALARTEVDATETTVEMTYWAMAAEWADSLGADIISTSLGYNTFDFGLGNYSVRGHERAHHHHYARRRDRGQQGHPGGRGGGQRGQHRRGRRSSRPPTRTATAC